jgi:hypothetical protein
VQNHSENSHLRGRRGRWRSRLSKTRKKTARTRVSNGRDILPGIDGRSVTARRYRDLATAIATDQGGADHLSEARIQLIRRFAAAAVLAEAMEARLVAGEKIDTGEHALLCSTLVRLASRIGIDRRSKDVTPLLKDYLDDASEVEDADLLDSEIEDALP